MRRIIDDRGQRPYGIVGGTAVVAYLRGGGYGEKRRRHSRARKADWRVEQKERGKARAKHGQHCNAQASDVDFRARILHCRFRPIVEGGAVRAFGVVESGVIHKKLWLDTTMIRQILVNLLSNAIKYTPAGGEIIYSAKELPSERPGWCYVQGIIKDNGIGMSKEFLPHIFEQFEREQTTTTGKVEGSGLGMAIVKRMLDMLGAKINVESELGKGTTITILMEHRYVENEKQTTTQKEQPVQGASFAGRRVLLAEDNNLNAEIAMTVLSEAGLLVERAADGKECVALIKQHEAGYYDVVLMDVHSCPVI